MLFTLPQAVLDVLAAGRHFPSRLGTPADSPKLAKHIVENNMFEDEVIQPDGSIWLARN